jgi:hypothetical protein
VSKSRSLNQDQPSRSKSELVQRTFKQIWGAKDNITHELRDSDAVVSTSKRAVFLKVKKAQIKSWCVQTLLLEQSPHNLSEPQFPLLYKLDDGHLPHDLVVRIG